MQNIKDFYILGQPLETKLGKIRFLKVEEYPLISKYTSYLNLEKCDVLLFLREFEDKFPPNTLKSFEDLSFVELIHALEDVIELGKMIREFFILLFGSNVFDLILTDDEYDEYRELIMKMNCINYEKKSSNPEIEYYNRLKRMYKSKKGGDDLTFESIYTSVWFALGHEPKELTIYQLYSMFHRVAQFETHHTTVLYSTVAEKVKIEPWYKHISISDDKEQVTFEEFSKNANDLFV